MTRFIDLTKEQQEHFKRVSTDYEVPEGCTHVDIEDIYETSFMMKSGDDWYVYTQGDWIEYDVSFEEPYYPLPSYNPEDGDPLNKSSKVRSDGGSSSYYTIKLTDKVIAKIVESGSIETEDIIKCAYNNDFDFGNIQKCLKRLYEISQGGGKEGNSAQYEINKIRYTLNKLEANCEA